MADNRFKNDEFEDIFSNSSNSNEYEDIYSSSDAKNEYEDISSFSSEQEDEVYEEDYVSDDFTVKYNSAVQNRRRQEIQYDDISDVFSGMATEEKKKKKKGHPVRNTFLVFLCIVIVLVSCVGFYGYNTVNKLLSSFDNTEAVVDNEYISESLLYSDDEQVNILLVGVDAREGETDSRSDTMMLVTLDNKNGEIKLTSFLRDSYVEIAGRKKKEKLNAAYMRGGIQTLVDTLELNFKVSIPYYVVVDFEIFTTIVDELGGINVDVTEKESYYTYHSGKVGVPVRIEAGEDVLLNGEQALWYSRIRYLDSDFMRTQRQRKVITAIVEKTLQQDIMTMIGLAETIIPLVKTNLSSDEIMSIGVKALLKQAYSYPIVQQQIPAEKTWSSKSISGVGSCLVMDFEDNIKIMQSFLSEKQVEEIETSTENK
ncbi:MAG: LCP family protein [Clostridia bacterium]|nr:LCP family protein [Clostridia bacterium]